MPFYLSLNQEKTYDLSPTNEIINDYWCNKEKPTEECIYGLISDGKSFNNDDKQYLYINLRPIDNSRITKLFNQIWKQSEYKFHPSIFLNINLNHGQYDINLTPDKREVMIKNVLYLIYRKNIFLKS